MALRHLLLTITCVLSVWSSLRAANHPEIEWRTVATKHFLIHYYNHTEPALYAVSKIAEESFPLLAQLYAYEFKDRINISIADYDDFSNGFAEWTKRSIMIWVPDLRFELRGNSPWLRNVVNHELAHIMTLEKNGGLQTLSWVASMQYTAPHAQVELTEPFAIGRFFPSWFDEGIAQYESQKQGGDCWDSRRDMILRCAVLADKQLSLDAMGHFNHGVIGNEMVYNHGYSLVAYLAEHLGEEVIARIWSEGRNGSLGQSGFESFFTQMTGRSLPQLHAQWLDSLRTTFKNTLPAARSACTHLSSKGTLNNLPRVSPDGRSIGFLTNDRDDFSRTDLVLQSRENGREFARVERVRNDWSFARDGRTVFFVKAYDPNWNGSIYNDLYSFNLESGRQQRLTHDARVYAIAALPGSNRLACVTFTNSVFSIALFDLRTKRFRQIVPGALGQPFNAIAAITDSAFVVSRVCGDGKSRLFSITLSGYTAAVDTLSPGVTSQEESPYYGADERIYYSADYDGIFNIYSILPDGSDCRRHTTVTGGMFSPVLINSTTLAASEYTADGFRIVTVTADTGEPYGVPVDQRCPFNPLPIPSGRVVINSLEYSPKFLRAEWSLYSYAAFSDYWGQLALLTEKGRLGNFFDSIGTELGTGISIYRSDAVGKRAMAFGVSAVAINQQASYSQDVKQYNEDTINFDGGSAVPFLNNRFGAEKTVRLVQERNPSRRWALLGERLLDPQGNRVAKSKAQNHSLATGEPPDKPADWAGVLVPSLSIQNRRGLFDLDFDLVGQISLQSLVPQILINTRLGGSIGRDWQVGIMPQLILPLVSFQIPLYLVWQHDGYYNNNMQYNRNGLIRFQAMVSPFESPLIYTYPNDSIEIQYKWGTWYSVGGSYAFPVTRYSSLTLSSMNQWTTMEVEFKSGQSRLDSYSSMVYTTDSRLLYTFPIARNINKGQALYADALYGTVFCALDYEANNKSTGVYMRAQNGIIKVVYDPLTTFCSPAIGAGIDFGFVKNYLFSRTLSTSCRYDLFAKKVDVVFSVGF